MKISAVVLTQHYWSVVYVIPLTYLVLQYVRSGDRDSINNHNIVLQNGVALLQILVPRTKNPLFGNLL